MSKNKALVETLDLDSGVKVMLPESKTVEIEVLPLADGNKIIPATLRSLMRSRRNRQGMPTKLRSARRANPARGLPYATVTWDCKPYPMWKGAPKRYTIRSGFCCVRDECDARDSLFSELSESDRKRILRAVAASSRTP